MAGPENGVYDPGKASQEMTEMVTTKKAPRGPVDKRNHLSLVQGHLLQLGNIPRACWEPVSTLLTEYYHYRTWGLSDEEAELVLDEDVEYLAFQKNWVNLLFTTSQSVDGRQADLMVRGMGADKAWEAKHPAAQVAGDATTGKPQSQGSERRGWLGRRT